MESINKLFDVVISKERDWFFWVFFVFCLCIFVLVCIMPITALWVRLLNILLYAFNLSFYTLNFVFKSEGNRK